MKEKIAKRVKEVAMEMAEKSVGKSFPLGTYEIEVPKELRMKKEQEER